MNAADFLALQDDLAKRVRDSVQDASSGQPRNARAQRAVNDFLAELRDAGAPWPFLYDWMVDVDSGGTVHVTLAPKWIRFTIPCGPCEVPRVR
jgi:hypothetical protein